MMEELSLGIHLCCFEKCGNTKYLLVQKRLDTPGLSERNCRRRRIYHLVSNCVLFWKVWEHSQSPRISKHELNQTAGFLDHDCSVLCFITSAVLWKQYLWKTLMDIPQILQSKMTWLHFVSKRGRKSQINSEWISQTKTTQIYSLYKLQVAFTQICTVEAVTSLQGDHLLIRKNNIHTHRQFSSE